MSAEHCSAHDYDDPGKPSITWDDADARGRLVDALVTDAQRLLGRLDEQPPGSRAAEAVALLALVAGQDVEPAEGSDGTDGARLSSARLARPARYGPDAPVAAPAKTSRCAPTTRGNAPPARPLVIRTGWPNTVSTGP